MWAPAPFQSPWTGLGSSLAVTPPVVGVGDVDVLADAIQQPAGNPELVGNERRARRAYLELPLRGHDLGVDAGDHQASLEAGVQVLLDDGAAEHLVGADAAVVAALGGRKAVGRPAKGLDAVEESVLLLDAEPGVEASVLLGGCGAGRPGVGGVGGHVGQQDFAHGEDVVPAADGVRAGVDGPEHAVGVLTGGLVGAGAVEAPEGKRLAGGDDLGLGAQLGRGLGAVNPDVDSPVDAHPVLLESPLVGSGQCPAIMPLSVTVAKSAGRGRRRPGRAGHSSRFESGIFAFFPARACALDRSAVQLPDWNRASNTGQLGFVPVRAGHPSRGAHDLRSTARSRDGKSRGTS